MRVKAVVNGSPKRIYACTRCLRSGESHPCCLSIVSREKLLNFSGFFSLSLRLKTKWRILGETLDMEDLAMKLTRLSLPSAADALALIQSELSSLPSLDLSSLPPEETALFLVDLIEGFAREGPSPAPW